MHINILNSKDVDFLKQLQKLIEFEENFDFELQKTVSQIIKDVKRYGDEALLRYTAEFEGLLVESSEALEIGRGELEKAWNGLGEQQKRALEVSASRIRYFHKKQLEESWSFREKNGSILGQRVNAIEKIGLYVPGGKASYPSTVLMNAIPAKVAGVKELVMVVPTPNGRRSQLVLAAALVAGVDRIFTIGGAQAIAALAFGTSVVPQVNKIVGPGNAYVAEAKRQVFGRVGIDMIAGPSEVLVVADQTVNPEWIAMDLFSQAEHDEMAQALLLSWETSVVENVEKNIRELIKDTPRADIIKASFENRSALLEVRDKAEALEIINLVAPEHLEIAIENPRTLADEVSNAGAIFIGKYSSEALGDYCAGPNHVLPTNGTARFSSPLGVYDFQKRSSLIEVSETGAIELGKIAGEMATGEGLHAHAKSALMRTKSNE